MSTQTVVISVSGDVADIESCPDGITVVIHDYDNCDQCDDESEYERDHCPDYCQEEDR